MTAVVNSTPLIALAICHQLTLLKQLFKRVYIPASVYQEVVQQGQQRPGARAIAEADWLIVRGPDQVATLPPQLIGLDSGETDVLLLAGELTADWVIIDERLGRRVARTMGFKIKGTLGVLLVAYRANLLTKAEAQTAVNALRKSSIRLSSRLYDWFNHQLEL